MLVQALSTEITLHQPPSYLEDLSLIGNLKRFNSWIKLISDQYEMGGETEKEKFLIVAICFVIGAWEESLEADIADEIVGQERDYERANYAIELGDFLNYVLQINRHMGNDLERWNTLEIDILACMDDEYSIDLILKERTLNFAGTLKRIFRNDPGHDQYKQEFAVFARLLVAAIFAKGQFTGIKPAEIIMANQAKLLDRVNRGKLTGRGDKR